MKKIYEKPIFTLDSSIGDVILSSGEWDVDPWEQWYGLEGGGSNE